MPVASNNVVRKDVVAELLAPNHDRFLGFVRSRVGSDAIAEDILHGAYLKAVERVGDLASADSAIAWFYRILATATVDHFRATSRERKVVEAFRQERDVAVPEEGDGKPCACVNDVLPTLKPEYAAAIGAVDVAGLAVEQHASAVGITPNNASVRLHRARAALRKRVVAVCGACADQGCFDCSCS